MFDRKLEKLYLLHVILFIILFIFLNKNYNFNILEEASKQIDEYQKIMYQEIDIVSDNMMLELKSKRELENIARDDKDNYFIKRNSSNISEYDIAEYRIENKKLVDEAIYYTNYYLPAFMMLIILLIVLFENFIVRKIKLAILSRIHFSNDVEKQEKIKKLICEKIKYRYKKVFLPKRIPIVCLIFYILVLITNTDNEILMRAFDNCFALLATVVTVFGIRVVIRKFKVKSQIMHGFIVLANVILGILLPQVYFVIGMVRSLFTIKVVLHFDDEK